MSPRLIVECLCGWERDFQCRAARVLAPVVIRKHLEDQDPADHVVNIFEAPTPDVGRRAGA